MHHDGKPASRTASSRPGNWLGTALVTALVVALLGILLVVGSILRNRQLGTAAQLTPTPTAAAGTVLSPPRAAPAFKLTDQNGQTLSLQSLRGHVVVLMFLDATCTQACPVEVQFLNQTSRFMGAQQTARIQWVAISVNATNTPAQASAFLEKEQAAMRVRFLLGSQTQLAPLWKAYGIQVLPGTTDVTHTPGLYVLDAQGREVEWVDVPFDAKQLSADLTRVLGG